MGRPEKAANLKVQHGGKGKKGVSEATISKLMNDFHCTRFLTNGKKVTDQDNSPENELYSKQYAEMVTSLKHLHLKKPVDRRTKQRERKEMQQKSKSVNDNKYNLSVAATSQQSILWSGKLSSIIANRSESNNVILHPSKLSTSVKWEKPLCSPSLTSSHQLSSSDEKSRIANTLQNPNISLFSNRNTSTTTTPSSFSKLSNTSKSPDNETNGSTLHVLKGSNDLLCSDSSQPHRLAYRKVSAQCTQQTHSNCRNNNFSCSSDQNALFCAAADCVPVSYQEKQNSAIVASSSNTSVSSGIVPERSCSEEMRMEEANVNELASYFEDLLHIPRKMSVMAEMMYA